jgi:dTDP-4-dehydrorhamnose 3,5-epimerase
MRFEPLAVDGACVVSLEPRGDERGWFSRLFCQQEMAENGLDPRISQVNNSLSRDAGTLRGMHFQRGAAAETKLVRVVAGAVFDVVVDLRPESPTFKSWAAVELTADNRKMLYVPRGCGHGILTLVDDTELIYFASQAYSAQNEGGVRWDDPAFGIEWPREPTLISDKDASWPDFEAA